MPRTTSLAASSRDSLLTLRRVERQQRLVELLVARRGEPATTERLARDLHASRRSVERDLARLRDSGVPVRARRGPGGGSWLDPAHDPPPLDLDVPELAALVSSLVSLGPTATDSAAAAMRKLVAALADDDGGGGERSR